MCPVKREAGAIPARSRHRNSRAHVYEPLGDREGGSARQIDQPGDLPAAVRGSRNARIPGHEALAVRNMEIGGICTGLFVLCTSPRGEVFLLEKSPTSIMAGCFFQAE